MMGGEAKGVRRDAKTSLAERALALLKAEGRAMRSGELAEKLGVVSNVIAKTLQPHVESGALVTCIVTNPAGGRLTHEYRLSASGPIHACHGLILPTGRVEQDPLTRALASVRRAKEARREEGGRWKGEGGKRAEPAPDTDVRPAEVTLLFRITGREVDERVELTCAEARAFCRFAELMQKALAVLTGDA